MTRYIENKTGIYTHSKNIPAVSHSSRFFRLLVERANQCPFYLELLLGGYRPVYKVCHPLDSGMDYVALLDQTS